MSEGTSRSASIISCCTVCEEEEIVNCGAGGVRRGYVYPKDHQLH